MSNDYWNRIYCGPPADPSSIWTSWNLDPIVLVPLLLFAALQRDFRGLAAAGVLLLAFVSPLCALSSSLFSARVLHHVLLTAVAAPLIACRRSPGPAGPMMLPFALSAVIFWSWHAPAAYDFALSHVAIYWLMQLTLLASAIWFWRAVLHRDRPSVEALAFIVLGFAQMGMLGAVLTFAPQPLFAAHAIAPLAWGITSLADQQAGGLIMWVPSGLPFAIAGLLVARRSWPHLRRHAA